MSVLNAKSNTKQWWNHFPPALRVLTRTRLLASFGAGGVIYLSPLVFNQLNLSAAKIGSGLAAAAIAGTISRLISGRLLDIGKSSSFLIKLAAFVAIIGDLWLLIAQNYSEYIGGQLFVGAAAGLYWPAVELAVPASCTNLLSSKGFALVRSADALGTSLGALLGSISAWLGIIRAIYLIDIFCMLLLLSLLAKQPIKTLQKPTKKQLAKISFQIKKATIQNNFTWLNLLFPILALSLLSTGIFSLLQSTLPLDLVKGGILRPPLSEAWSGSLIAIQLGLLVIFQWPVGNWLAGRSIKVGLRISLLCFSSGCFLLGISALSKFGIIIALASQVPLAVALAAFLPTATEAITQVPPKEHRGIAMAMYSQCFAVSAFIAPTFAGWILDKHGNGVFLWLLMSAACIIMLPTVQKVRIKKKPNFKQ